MNCEHPINLLGAKILKNIFPIEHRFLFFLLFIYFYFLSLTQVCRNIHCLRTVYKNLLHFIFIDCFYLHLSWYVTIKEFTLFSLKVIHQPRDINSDIVYSSQWIFLFVIHCYFQHIITIFFHIVSNSSKLFNYFQNTESICKQVVLHRFFSLNFITKYWFIDTHKNVMMLNKFIGFENSRKTT